MADFAVQPVDYNQLANSVPNPLAGEAALVNIGNARVQGEAIQQQMAMRRIALQRQIAFGQDLGGYVQNPTPQGLATLFGKYPEFEQQAAAARSALDRGDITELGSAAALAAKGDYDGAAQIVQQRIASEKAAGSDTSQAQHVLDLLQSGKPDQQRAALGALSLGVAVAVGPDKAADFLKANGMSQEPVAVGLDQRLVTPQGQEVAGAHPNLVPVTVNNADGSQTATAMNPQTGVFGSGAVAGQPQPGGDGQTSTVGTGTPQQAISTVLHNEGGLNKSDMNGYPTNFGINFKANQKELAAVGITSPKQMGNLTQAEAANIYATKYWPQSGAAKLPANLQTPYFDVYVRNPALAKRALAQSGGDPAKFMQIATVYFQNMAAKNPKAAKYAAAWANRDAANTAMATAPAGDATAAAPVASAPATAEASAAPSGANQTNPYVFGGNTGVMPITKGAEPGFRIDPKTGAEIPITGGTEDPNSYNPQEVDDLARNWIVTGQWAGGGGGMGGGNIPNGLKKAAMARASSIMQSLGIPSEQLPQLRSQYGADKTSLANINGVLTGLQGSENALRANAQQVFKTQKKLVDDGIIDNGTPLLNDLRMGTYKHVGSGQTKADIKAYEDAMNAYSVEYAKFMSSANGIGGSAAPSDASQERASDLNDTSMGPKALQAHIHQTLIEAENRRKGIEAQVVTLNHRLASYLQPRGQTPSGTTQIHTVEQYNSLPHGAHYIDPTGTYRIKP